MRAIICREYGPPEVLALEDVPIPTPGEDEVLVRVLAASVNSWDWDNLRGKPLVSRMLAGITRPKHPIPGGDIAGRVEAVGKNVTRFRPGEAVFGDLSGSGWGAFAEYVCAPAAAVVPKPAQVTFEQAAAVPQGGVIALQGVRDYGRTRPGHRVLINGAGGGVGTFAVQLAKSLGAEVTGVDGPHKLDMVRSIGADHVIDYTREDYTDTDRRYDLIIDCVTCRSIRAYARVLGPEGIYLMVGGELARVPRLLLFGGWLALTSKKKMTVLAHKPNKDLAYLAELLEAGTITPVIDGHYELSDVPEALRQIGEGRVRGKAVITIGDQA